MRSSKTFLKGKLILWIGIVSLVLFALVGCAAQGEAKEKASEEAKGEPSALAVDWSMDSDCVTCHAIEAASMNDAKCLAGVHKEESTTCADCHTDEAALKKVHEGATGASSATKLKKTKVSTEACLACHTSLAEIAAKTADISITDSQGKAVNPHALPSSESHDSIACSDCHVSHVASDTQKEAKGTCLSCHHSDVFECGTCHS